MQALQSQYRVTSFHARGLGRHQHEHLRSAGPVTVSVNASLPRAGFAGAGLCLMACASRQRTPQEGYSGSNNFDKRTLPLDKQTKPKHILKLKFKLKHKLKHTFDMKEKTHT